VRTHRHKGCRGYFASIQILLLVPYATVHGQAIL
jgi:hypothetical protein